LALEIHSRCDHLVDEENGGRVVELMKRGFSILEERGREVGRIIKKG